MEPMHCSGDEDNDPYFSREEFEKQMNTPLLSSKEGKIVDVEWTTVLAKGLKTTTDVDKRFNPTGLLAVQCDKKHNISLGHVLSEGRPEMIALSRKAQAKQMFRFTRIYNKYGNLLRNKIVEARMWNLEFEEKYRLVQELLCEIHDRNIETGMETFQNFEDWNA
jgi:hypothetical protein